ncbi:MAG: N-acetyltransferase, partial [Planctomycetia bacterium]
MTGVALPPQFSLELLQRKHQRHLFDCGHPEVNEWLHTRAMQHQDKRLSATKVLLDQDRAVAGFYTLATGQVDFGDLPADLARKLPRRALPVVVLAWLGVSKTCHGEKFGNLL